MKRQRGGGFGWAIHLHRDTLTQGRFKANSAALADVVESNEPRIIAFNIYANEEGDEVSVVQVHPDAESMMLHMQVVRQHIIDAYADSLDATTSMTVYGQPSDDVLAVMTQLASPGGPLLLRSHATWLASPGPQRPTSG